MESHLLESEPAGIRPEAAGTGPGSPPESPPESLPGSLPESLPGSPAESGQAVLADLIAAGLVSHEMIGDPARLGGETAALRLLCAQVAGPVWRIGPYHYAFRADPPGDAPARAAALEAALAAEFGPEAVWVSATEAPGAADLDRPLLLLRGLGEAVLEAAGPEAMAVVGAGFAARAARIAAEGAAAAATAAVGDLRAGLDRLDGRLAAVEAAEARIATALDALGSALGQVLARLDGQADVLHAHIAREDLVAGRLAELAALAGTPAAFTETLGLTLAEFLARIEALAESRARIRAPSPASVSTPVPAGPVRAGQAG